MSTEAALPSAPGTLPSALGRYQVVRLLGQGAMGRVLLAYDPVLDREVAVKHLRDDLKIPPEVREGLIVRMRHEARAAARVMHPHLVTLHDMGEDPELGLYLVFEYVEGPTLKQRLLRGRLDPELGARLARELGAALTVAHSAGVVHRDVKPENIILSKGGGKIADFGIARIPDSTLTHAGGLMGTPAYSAPETFSAGAFSPESDQFSLAASIYEALSGDRAFPGDDAIQVASRIANDPPARFAQSLGLPAALDDALLRAMAKRPEDRFSSCEAFGIALESAVGRNSFPPRVDVEAAPAPVLRERNVGQIALGAVALVGMAVLLGRAFMQGFDAPTTAASAMPEGSGSAGASARPSGSSHKPKAPLGSARPTKPKAGTDSTADVDPSAAPEASSAPQPADAGVDAGTPDAGAVGGDAGPTTPVVTPTTSAISPSAPPPAMRDAGP